MGVIGELSLPAEEFELGRILAVEEDTDIVLETMVPLEEEPVPLFRLIDGTADNFVTTVRDHPAVDRVAAIETYEEETLYALDWTPSQRSLFAGITALDVHLLEATGTCDVWVFKLRFRSHEVLTGFRDYCTDADVDYSVERVYRPTSTETAAWHGLTTPQRETLVAAVEAGYYAVPREITTAELADEFGISDQAVIERLRRAIATLVENTLVVSHDD